MYSVKIFPFVSCFHSLKGDLVGWSTLLQVCMRCNGTSITISSLSLLSFYELFDNWLLAPQKGRYSNLHLLAVFHIQMACELRLCLSGMFSVHWDEVQIILDDFGYGL